MSPSGDIMKFEFYTTNVKGYTAQIVAELKDNTVVKSDVRNFYVTKKEYVSTEEIWVQQLIRHQ